MKRHFVKAAVCGAIMIAGAAALLMFVSGCAKITDAGKAGPAASKKAAKYYCPMHPTYTSDKPGSCPICNMALVPIEAHDDHSTHEMKPTDKQTVCLRHECPMIKAGENCPMLIVSESGEIPECPVCEKRIAEAELKAVSTDHLEGYSAVSLSPEKRRMIGIKTSKVQNRPVKTSVRASGQMLTGGQIDLLIYENDLPKISDSSTVKAVFPALGRELTGRISRIPLSIDRGLPMSSIGSATVHTTGFGQVTLRARIEDPDGLLRRGMSADAEILTELAAAAAVPEEAVFFTGKMSLVFIERSEGVYEPRAVELGAHAEGHYQIKSGVTAGETVVTSGNFLIDSESRLRSAIQGAVSGDDKSAHAH